MGRTACTEPQCLYSRAIPLLPLCAVRPVQSLSACTRVHFTLHNIGVNFHTHTVHLDIIKVLLFTNWCSSELSKNNFNVNFKIVFKTIYLCINWWRKRTLMLTIAVFMLVLHHDPVSKCTYRLNIYSYICKCLCEYVCFMSTEELRIKSQIS
jgi:hypothetical protein